MTSPKKVLQISTQDLKSSAPTFHTQSERLRDATVTLTSKLDALGSPWGGDEQGKKFEHTYTPNRHKIVHAVGILKRGLASIHGAMADMADGHIDNEEVIKGMFAKGKPSADDPAQAER